MENEDIWLEVTCYALRLPHGGWDIQCGPLPFADIQSMHTSKDATAVLLKIASCHVRRDISIEEDKAMRMDFINTAKQAGWLFDNTNACWISPKEHS